MTKAAYAFLFLALAACSSSQKEAQGPADAASPAEKSAPIGALAPGEPATRVPVEADDIVVGSPTADVTLVAFLDFECPFCIQSFSSLTALRDAYPESQLRIVLKQHPLPSHEAAIPAAVAAQAVSVGAGGEAGFEFSRELFERRDLSFGALADAAERAGVDREKYSELVESEETVQRVIADLKLAAELGVRGTPAFFVNGRMLTGLTELETFQRVIDEERSQMRALVPKSSFARVYAERVDKNLRTSLVEGLLAADPLTYRVPVDGSPIDGPKDALVTLVVFSDFECPYCQRAENTVRALRKRYGNDLRVVFKHAPLPFHRNARPAARLAVLAQAKKGDAAFYDAATRLFAQRAELGPSAFLQIGASLGLTEAEIEQATLGELPFVEAQLTRDADLVEDLEVRGTPHFFINGHRLVGAQPLETFEALIDYELSHAKSELARAGDAQDIYEFLQKDGVSPGLPEPILVSVPTTDRPKRGPKTAKAEIHVFSDYQCPFCRKAEQMLKSFEAEHGEDFVVVWHDLPLEFHKRALPAARAGREAFRQKGDAGFWAMHRLLFGLDVSVALIEDAEIEAHAKQLKLNERGLKEALSGALDATIEADRELAQKLGIEGTPAFFVTRPAGTSGYLIKGLPSQRRLERILALTLGEQP